MGFEQGLSGLNAASKSLDVIGNNVANASTVGFKQSQAQFADIYANSLGGGGSSVAAGIGVQVAAVAQQFTQGNITTTNNSLDMAISGSGFFRMSNNGTITYSRNGQFQLDKNGFIVDNQGKDLTGYQPNAAGVIVATTPGPIQISTANLLPKASTAVTAGVNLNANAAIIPAAPAFDPNNPATFDNSTSATIYDSLGGSHIASMYFAKTSANTWNTYLTVDGAMVPPGGATPGLLTPMTFNTNGTLATPTTAVTSASFTPSSAAITLAGSTITGGTTVTVPSTAGLVSGATVTGDNFPAGTTITITGPTTFTTSAPGTNASGVTLNVTNPPSAAPQTLSFNFGSTTQFGTTFGVNSLSQDGYTSGQMTGFTTGSDGMVTGRYSNGQTRTLGQVVLANFSNAQGLQSLGNNQWAETSTSGNPLVGTPGSASLGVLQTSATEDSNVDLTAELVNMITAQRAYQANAQTIKTQDQIMQTIVNLR
ncbi:flagellar hook protein FlgE [mine drainage metagenome]|uniref:Flagellar hook protein FlgE n=1 Tax=mine drainage metagenome TaxID=410659 RepID=A0A1J5TID6_9ZZZZ